MFKKYFTLPKYLLAAVVCLAACKSMHVQKTETQHAAMAAGTEDQSTVAFISPYKQKLDSAMNVVIGFAPEALVKQQPESNLGNFFSDAMLHRAYRVSNVDTSVMVSIFNYGGLRTSVPQGEVHVGNMFEVMPFENQLVLFPMKGSDLLRVLNVAADKGGAPIAGIRFEIADKKPRNVFVHQLPLDTTKMYTVVTSDYLAGGGDYFFSVATPKNVTNTNWLLRDILIESCKEFTSQNKPIAAKPDGRISIAK
jgi:2',3'-cyclic-nucleotide 2'-phosphodiesterase (5'-nucleotidase family)